jgi:hypothetical protein
MPPILHLFRIRPAASGRRESHLILGKDIWLVFRVEDEEFLPIGTKEIHHSSFVVVWLFSSIHWPVLLAREKAIPPNLRKFVPVHWLSVLHEIRSQKHGDQF